MTEQSYAMAVTVQVREELRRQRRSGAWLASELGLSTAYIQRRLTGAVPFSLADVFVIAEVLRVPLSQLVLPEQQLSLTWPRGQRVRAKPGAA
jgi:transcriptional regulator with XRE-family HTH domain